MKNIFKPTNLFSKKKLIERPKTIGRQKSKILISAVFEPLKEKGHISKEEFDKIINSDRKTHKHFLQNMFGKIRGKEIETYLNS